MRKKKREKEFHPLSIQCEGGRLHDVCPGRSVWWVDNDEHIYARWGAEGIRSTECECDCHA